MASSKVRMEGDIQGDKLTQCFDDIMKAATEMMVQQQLKTIQLNSEVAAGFRKSLSKSLGDKVRLFHSILDGVESTLSTASEYLNAVDEEAMKAKQWQKQQEEELRRKQFEEIEKSRKLNGGSAGMQGMGNDQYPNHQQSPLDLKVPSPNRLLSDLDTGNIDAQESNRGVSEKAFSAEFGDLNDMDISMFGGMDGQGDFSLEDFNMGNSNVSSTNKNEIGNHGMNNMSINDRNNGNNVPNNGSAYLTSKPSNGLSKSPKHLQSDSISSMRSNSNNPSGQSSTEQVSKLATQQGSMNPDDYLTLNDFNDLGIDWNTTDDNNELDLNDFNI
ncbi:HEL008Cp [Eremothecium sinecaudum]|uniref:HEL008Cp n=1 Tax=Eremothecium sinecaudum TaxID=45286 RepID=A0A120K2E6_9SACH|nr:HEL008Cp [Eremothecium sinecaudum]AMD21272.1 HEL008Cp [Eremothecium sinecaudum]